MKKIKFLAFAIVIYSSVSATPGKPANLPHLSNIVFSQGDLSDDPVFIQLVKNEIDFARSVYEALGKNGEKLAARHS